MAAWSKDKAHALLALGLHGVDELEATRPDIGVDLLSGSARATDLAELFFAFFNEAQRRWVASAAGAAACAALASLLPADSVVYLASVVADADLKAAFAPIVEALGWRTCHELGYVTLYALTAFERLSYGERAVVQLLATGLGQRMSKAHSYELAGLHFLDVSARIGTRTWDQLLQARPFVQVVLALLTGRLLVEWYTDTKMGKTYLIHLYRTTLDYSFPTKAIRRLAVAADDEDAILAAMESAFDSVWFARELGSALRVFGLEEKLAKRHALRKKLQAYARGLLASAEFQEENRRGMKRAREDDDA